MLRSDGNNLLQVMLRLLGYEVASAKDGRSAIKALQDAQFQILITDLGLPDMPGELVAERARNAWPDMRIIVASGQAKTEDTPTDAVLLKPYSLFSLQAAIARVMVGWQ